MSLLTMQRPSESPRQNREFPRQVTPAGYFDDDAESKIVARGLSALGFLAVRATDSGMRGQPDEAHLSYATGRGLVLITANRGDFLRLHSEWIRDGRSHAGIIILLQQRYSPGEQVRRLERLMRALSADDMRSRVEFLSNWGG
jgi:hypothetical protein